MLFVETPGHVVHLSPAFTFTNKWILLLWAPLLPIHCIQTQPLCLYAAEGLVTPLAATCMQAARHTPWQPSAERDKEDPELAAVLRQVSDKYHITKVQFVPFRCMHCLRQIRQHVACHNRAALSHTFSSLLPEGHAHALHCCRSRSTVKSWWQSRTETMPCLVAC